MQQLREALKILAERVLILEHMIGVHGEEKLDYAKEGLLTFCKKKNKKKTEEEKSYRSRGIN